MNARTYHDSLYGGRHLPREIVVLCERRYVTYRLSYRDLVELTAERGVYVAHCGWQLYSRPVSERPHSHRTARRRQ